MNKKEHKKEIEHLIKHFSKEQLAELYVYAKEEDMKESERAGKWYMKYKKLLEKKQ